MEINRITFKSYNDLDEQHIKQYYGFCLRVYKAVSKHHPQGVIAQTMLVDIERCEEDYKMLGTMAGAIKASLRGLSPFKNKEE